MVCFTCVTVNGVLLLPNFEWKILIYIYSDILKRWGWVFSFQKLYSFFDKTDQIFGGLF